MVQVLLAFEEQERLLAAHPASIRTSMARNMVGHHVTLVYKPAPAEEARLGALAGKPVTVTVTGRFATDLIEAVSVDLEVDGAKLEIPGKALHITMAGVAPPAASNVMLASSEKRSLPFEPLQLRGVVRVVELK